MNSGGRITLESTVTSGNLRLTGTLELVDNSTGAAVVDDSQVIYPEYLQLAVFENKVHINTQSTNSGTKFPIGTKQSKVNNLADALLIARYRGIDTIALQGTIYISDTDIDDFKITGDNNLNSVVVLLSGNTNNKTIFKDCVLTGELNGYITAESVAVTGLSGIGSETFPTLFRDCIIRGDIGIKPALKYNPIINAQNVHFIDCVSGVPGNESPTIDFNGSDAPTSFRRYGGGIKLSNHTANQGSTFEFNQGKIIIDSSCTLGAITIGGIYDLVNNGTLGITERNSSVTANISTPSDAIAIAVWGYLTSSENTDGSFGELLLNLITKSNEAQHTLNVQTEMLKNKPNNC
jgi:hypothetical protein